MEKVIEKAGVLIEALPYIQKFRDDTVVVKFGGSMMDDEAACRGILQDVAFMEVVGLRPVVVHGGGKAISRKMQEAGLRPTFVQGLRVTDAASITVVEAVLNREVNPRMVSWLEAFGCRGRGIRGEDVIQARRRSGADSATGAPLDWGYVGEPTGIDTVPMQAFLNSKMVPVVTPLGRGEDGRVYNINADEAAAAIACALGARKLVFLSDVPGLLEDPRDAATRISHLEVGEVPGLKDRGVISGGMLPKIGAGVRALQAGVKKVHFIDASMPHSLLLELFTDQGVGTEIVS
jgi:acetylglutamate kinase